MKKETFILVSHDRHRDDLVYIFDGDVEQAIVAARVLFKRIFGGKKLNAEEYKSDQESNMVFLIQWLDRDYSVTVFRPEKEI